MSPPEPEQHSESRYNAVPARRDSPSTPPAPAPGVGGGLEQRDGVPRHPRAMRQCHVSDRKLAYRGAFHLLPFTVRARDAQKTF